MYKQDPNFNAIKNFDLKGLYAKFQVTFHSEHLTYYKKNSLRNRRKTAEK